MSAVLSDILAEDVVTVAPLDAVVSLEVVPPGDALLVSSVVIPTFVE